MSLHVCFKLVRDGGEAALCSLQLPQGWADCNYPLSSWHRAAALGPARPAAQWETRGHLQPTGFTARLQRHVAAGGCFFHVNENVV